MTAKFKKYILVIALSFSAILYSHKIYAIVINTEAPMPTDTRIKTYIYNPNEIFQVKFLVGYQSVIELQKDESVELITFGDPGPWSVKTLERRIFIKASDPGVKTNMNIYTDKRTYMLDIMSNDDDNDTDERITYVLRFFYPDINVDIPPTTAKLAKIALNKRIMANSRDHKLVKQSIVANAGTINTSYTYATKGEIKTIMPYSVFDNGTKTYFKFANMNILPTISAVGENYNEIPLRVKRTGEYVYVDSIEKQLTIRLNNELVCIFNENIPNNKPSVAYVNE